MRLSFHMGRKCFLMRSMQLYNHSQKVNVRSGLLRVSLEKACHETGNNGIYEHLGDSYYIVVVISLCLYTVQELTLQILKSCIKDV